jgi:hypothetical protein
VNDGHGRLHGDDQAEGDEAATEADFPTPVADVS